LQIKIKIDWSDMDLFGHVNNVAYFKYIQTARVNFCDKAQINTSDVSNKKSFAVAECTCDFKKPLFYPDEIKIESNVTWIKSSSFQIQHVILNSKNEICTFAKDVIVLFDYELHRKVIISEKQKLFLENNLINTTN